MKNLRELGLEVFGSDVAFEFWLNSQNDYGCYREDLLVTQSGYDDVYEELINMIDCDI